MASSKQTQSSTIKALKKELIELNAQPVEGFKVNVANEENMFVWDVAIFGPPMTLYEGGYFKASLSFPSDYPYSPPSLRFLTKMYHPNIYENGEVCISILHSPGEDPQSGELAAERWNPTQNVRTILLSVISLLNEPNCSSPAHVEASVNYRKWIESGGKENEYEHIVRGLVQITHEDAERDAVQVPTTLKDYCFSGRPGDDPDRSELDRDFSDFDDDYGYFPSDVDDDDDDGDGDDEYVDDDSKDPSTATSQSTAGHSGFRPRLDAGGTDSALEEAETEPKRNHPHSSPTVRSGQQSSTNL